MHMPFYWFCREAAQLYLDVLHFRHKTGKNILKLLHVLLMPMEERNEKLPQNINYNPYKELDLSCYVNGPRLKLLDELKITDIISKIGDGIFVLDCKCGILFP